MKKLAIVYHSAHGHTRHIAANVAEGAGSVEGTVVHVLKAEELAEVPERLAEYDGLILGSPTYLGGVSGTFKTLMDATGKMWRNQQLKGKLAAGFTVSSLPAGDKQSTLMSMFVFCMQHGMLWVSLDLLGGNATLKGDEENLNRLGGWLGAMAQARVGTDPEESPGASDLATARHLGAYVAGLACQFARRKRPF